MHTLKERLKVLFRVFVFQQTDLQIPLEFTEACYWTLWGPLYTPRNKRFTNWSLLILTLVLLWIVFGPTPPSSYCTGHPSFVYVKNQLIYCSYDNNVYLTPRIIQYSVSTVAAEGQRCNRPWTQYVSKYVKILHSGEVETLLDQTSSVDLQRWLLTNESSPVPPHC